MKLVKRKAARLSRREKKLVRRSVKRYGARDLSKPGRWSAAEQDYILSSRRIKLDPKGKR